MSTSLSLAKHEICSYTTYSPEPPYQAARSAMFFARNTFTIKISARAHHPVSLKPPLIFRPLGLPHCLYLLRDLRQIELEVNIDDRSAYATTRHRARIQHSVDIIKQYAQDKVRKFLLKRLHIRFLTDVVTRCRHFQPMTWMHNSCIVCSKFDSAKVPRRERRICLC
ncbi:hypothetical protein M3J09_009320 [Ascochyta lentis]